MPPETYQFSNGICLYRADLLDIQIARYAEPGNPNLHEPVEEDWMRRMIDRIPSPSPVFLDVGAAMGYYSILVKRLRPAARVFAIEALSRHVTALQATLALNGLAPEDVTIIQAAVATENGKATFVDLGYGSQLAEPSHGGNAIQVEARTLDDVLKETGPIDLMKMDIQGAELGVLGSARASLRAGEIRQIILGTHGEAIHAKVRDILVEAGYAILFDDPAPPMQPDGLIVASFRAF